MMEMEVSRCAALALWSCSKSRCSRTTIFKTGSVPLLAKLIKIDREEILIPVIGLVQECAIEVTSLHVSNGLMTEEGPIDVTSHVTSLNLLRGY